MAEIPCDTNIYLSEPQLGVPEIVQGKRGRHPKRIKVLSGQQPIKVRDLLKSGDLKWHRIRVRNSERGEINDAFAMQRVWLRYEDKAVQEWLIIRKESAKKHSYALCNASSDTSIQKLAWWKCQRYFIERANQDAKSEIGWDEFQAQKYRAWQHHLALTILACWFATTLKLEFAQNREVDPEIAKQFEIEVLPMLSLANIRLLLVSVMPLKQLTIEHAIEQINDKFFNRASSTESRLKKLDNDGIDVL
ncbi:transposase family protein [Candidatus Magnetobacterium bavaricum]|uniref:Transposase family protein n=1 Tax=Candidatus Magnetobacterium bavaricum TaxID=29290 RepID=A0A0F3GUQ9_9BACT|nr:transposase family protein [Candidatus Magnetobacterium bavaricum]